MRVTIPTGPPPAARQFHEIVRDAEKLASDPNEQGKAVHLLRELLLWTGLAPSPAEKERILACGGKPADYISIPVQIQVNAQSPGAIMPMQTPQGVIEMVVMHLVLPIPLAQFKASKILGAAGEAANPAEGMMPLFDARFTLPRQRIATHLLEALGLVPKAQEE